MGWLTARRSAEGPKVGRRATTGAVPDAGASGFSEPSSGAEASTDAIRREPAWVNPLIWFLITLYSFRQSAGQVTFDTKLDLSVDPAGFLERTLTAWNPMSAFGELQNQAYGYLFPHGLFFVLGDAAGIPDWVVQRLWSALLLIAAYEGARRLFRAIDHDLNRAWLPMLAGLAFALSPRLLGLSGALTGEIHPSVLLPWVVMPLVLCLRGRMTPLQGAAWSGVGILCMGGVNASEVLLALVLPGIVLLCGLGSAQGRRLMLWWPLAVIAATLWWVSGLLIQGRYAPPFLDYIETAAATTQPLGWANVVRGANHWLSFLWTGGEPWWNGSYQLATDAFLVAVGGLVAVISLGGLFHRRMPWRLPLALGFLAGALLLTLGHLDTLGSPFGGTFRSLLDGALSPFRNIHKLDPVLRLPMALGFAHAVGLLALWATAIARDSKSPAWGRSVRIATVAGAVLLLAVSGRPLFTDDLRRAGWTEIPPAWQQAAEYLGDTEERGRTMILPGAGFGQQTWGWTIDEPFQPLASAPWVSRSQVPLTPGSTIRYLDAIEERIQDGVGSPVLADALARAGVKHILLRRDLDHWATEAPSPARVDQALRLSPGFTHVASFGEGQSGGLPLIDVYEVDGVVPLAEAVALSSVKTLAGGPEDTLNAMEAGLLQPGELTVNASEEGWDEVPDVVGDGFRRRERQFGRLVDAVSQVMSADEPFRTSRQVHDYAGVDEADRVLARYNVLDAVTASTSAGYADTFGALRPENGPFAAVDGSEQSFWQSSPLTRALDQWLEVRFTEPQRLSEMRLTLGIDAGSGVPVRKVRITAGERSYDRSVEPATGEVVVAMDGAPVDKVRVSVEAVFGKREVAQVAIRELEFEGIEIERSLVLPDHAADARTATTFRARPHRRACVEIGFGPQCDAGTARVSEEEQGLDRVVAQGESGRYRIRGQVVARSTPAAAQLLDPYENQVTARASSISGWDPLVAGQRAMDGDTQTAWIAEVGAAEPTLELSWGQERRISRIRVHPALISGTLPTRVVIEAGGEVREVDLGPDSTGIFEPVQAEGAILKFPLPRSRPGGEPLASMVIGDITIEGLEDDIAPWGPDQETGSSCGFGPVVTIGDKEFETKIVGLKADVVAGTPMDLDVCGDDVALLKAGENRITATATAQFSVTSLTLDPIAGGRDEATPLGREVAITTWEATHRSLTVGPGDDALLRIPENVNTGWQALLDGQELEPLRLDGWQQGFRVPEGAGGTVELVFLPDRTYRLQMFVGAVVAMAMVALAVHLSTRGGVPAPLALKRVPQSLGRSSKRWWLGLGALAYLLGGVPVALGVVIGAWQNLRGRTGAWLPAVLASIAIGAQSVSAARGFGVDVGWADWLAGAAVGLWAALLIRSRGAKENR